MNKLSYTSIVVTILGLIWGIFGSSWLWVCIILLPFLIMKRILSGMQIFILIIFSFILWASAIDGGVASAGDMVVFTYILLAFLLVGRMFGIRIENKNNDALSPYIVLSLIGTLIGTIWISILMPYR